MTLPTVRSNRILTTDQILYAEWLALPTMERSPRSKDAFAATIGVSPPTLYNWEKLPELWDHRDSILRQYGKDLVPLAMRVIKQSLQQTENRKVALDAARDVLSRFADPARTAKLIVTLQDMYRNPHETEQQFRESNPVEGVVQEIEDAAD